VPLAALTGRETNKTGRETNTIVARSEIGDSNVPRVGSGTGRGAAYDRAARIPPGVGCGSPAADLRTSEVMT
jgi:hypothetical protein